MPPLHEGRAREVGDGVQVQPRGETHQRLGRRRRIRSAERLRRCLVSDAGHCLSARTAAFATSRSRSSATERTGARLHASRQIPVLDPARALRHLLWRHYSNQSFPQVAFVDVAASSSNSSIRSLDDLPKDLWEIVPEPPSGYHYRTLTQVGVEEVETLLDGGPVFSLMSEECFVELINAATSQ